MKTLFVETNTLTSSVHENICVAAHPRGEVVRLEISENTFQILLNCPLREYKHRIQNEINLLLAEQYRWLEEMAV